MRTTVILDPNLVTRPSYKVEPHAGGFRPAIDPDKLNQLVDQLEVEDFIADVARTRRRPP